MKVAMTNDALEFTTSLFADGTASFLGAVSLFTGGGFDRCISWGCTGWVDGGGVDCSRVDVFFVCLFVLLLGETVWFRWWPLLLAVLFGSTERSPR